MGENQRSEIVCHGAPPLEKEPMPCLASSVRVSRHLLSLHERRDQSQTNIYERGDFEPISKRIA
jgi:hypothetical protein